MALSCEERGRENKAVGLSRAITHIVNAGMIGHLEPHSSSPAQSTRSERLLATPRLLNKRHTVASGQSRSKHCTSTVPARLPAFSFQGAQTLCSKKLRHSDRHIANRRHSLHNTHAATENRQGRRQRRLHTVQPVARTKIPCKPRSTRQLFNKHLSVKRSTPLSSITTYLRQSTWRHGAQKLGGSRHDDRKQEMRGYRDLPFGR